MGRERGKSQDWFLHLNYGMSDLLSDPSINSFPIQFSGEVRLCPISQSNRYFQILLSILQTPASLCHAVYTVQAFLKCNLHAVKF